jgi:hypothetical protein
MPAASIAPLFIFLATKASAPGSQAAALTVSSETPEVNLLTIMAAKLGAAWAASKCSKDRPPFLAASV